MERDFCIAMLQQLRLKSAVATWRQRDTKPNGLLRSNPHPWKPVQATACPIRFKGPP
jgi:hypothetical protein